MSNSFSNTSKSKAKQSDYLSIVNVDSIFKRVSKHPRYKSDWASDSITVDVARDGEKASRFINYDLSDIWLPSNHPVGPFTKSVCITEFPYWISVIKLAVNELLHLRPTKPDYAARRMITLCTRLFGWCVQGGIYEMAALTKNDYKKLLKEIAQGGWYNALNVENRLFHLTLTASNNKELLSSLISDKVSKNLNAKLISKLTGIQLSQARLPSYLYQDFFSFSGIPEKRVRGSTEYDKPPTSGVILDFMSSVNLLYRLPSGIDKPGFLPYQAINNLAKNVTKSNAEGRTINLRMEDAVKLLDTAIKYVYDYAPGILALGDIIRGWFSTHSKNHINLHHVSMLASAYEKLALTYKLPQVTITSISQRKNGKSKRHNETDEELCFLDLVHTLQTACMTLIGINHGRRKNEILGEGHKPYGIYYGCVTTVMEGIKHNKLDIYIEKTVKDYVQFWCNDLVSDSVSVLENLHDLFRPLDADKQTGQFEVTRSEKLFRFKPFTRNSLNSDKWNSFIYHNHSNLFLEQSGVDRNCLDHKTHVFRRFFSIIYYYRYDNPLLISLMHHLQHRGPVMTRKYITDPTKRSHADSIAVLYNKEIEQQEEVSAEVADEYLRDKVCEIIHGRPTGGGMSKVVYGLYAHLLRRVEFRISTEESQLTDLCSNLHQNGYKPEPLLHGVCMITPACKQETASCYSNGSIHKDKASLKVCMPCPYSFDNQNYLDNMKHESVELNKNVLNFSITMAERLAYEEAASNLEKLIELEESIQRENAEAILALKASAYLVWGVHDTLKVSIKNEQKTSVSKSETGSV